jgi:hypothetical protein
MESARVDSIQVLRDLRVAMAKFAEAGDVALADAESEMMRTLNWLENEQSVFWQNQIRKRTEMLSRAKEALRMKKLFKDSSGRTPSAVDEEKAVARAKAALEEAERKVLATKKWAQRMVKEIQVYKGSVQRFATTVQSDVRVGMGKLEAWARALDAYVALKGPAGIEMPSAAEAAAPQGEGAAMARGEPFGGDPEFPKLEAPAAAVIHLDRQSGSVVTADGEAYHGEGGKYLVFSSVVEAAAYAQRKMQENPSLIVVVYDEQAKAV